MLLVARYPPKPEGPWLDIKLDCCVNRILNQGVSPAVTATALDTSAGVVPLNGAQLVLALGTLPATTLVRNSFANLEGIGNTLSAHFVSAIVAKIPQAAYEDAFKVSYDQVRPVAGWHNNSMCSLCMHQSMPKQPADRRPHHCTRFDVSCYIRTCLY
jgi:hypothetical protein